MIPEADRSAFSLYPLGRNFVPRHVRFDQKARRRLFQKEEYGSSTRCFMSDVHVVGVDPGKRELVVCAAMLHVNEIEYS